MVGILPRSPTPSYQVTSPKAVECKQHYFSQPGKARTREAEDHKPSSLSSTSLLDLAKGQGELARTIDLGLIQFFVPHDWIIVGGDFLKTVDLCRGHEEETFGLVSLVTWQRSGTLCWFSLKLGPSPFLVPVAVSASSILPHCVVGFCL